LHGQVGLARESQVPLHYLQLILAIARCEVDLCRLGRGQECIDELEVSIRRGEQLHIRLETMLTKGRILIMSGQNREALATLQDVYKRGRAADLPVVSEYARALMAEALWDLRTREEAAGMFEAASLGLLATGNIAMLALSCASRSHAMAGQMDPDVIFEPIKWMLDEQPIAILRVEHLIARARWHRRHKQRSQSRDTFRQAATLLNSVADVLNDTDRAALRVHPWSRHIHRGMRM